MKQRSANIKTLIVIYIILDVRYVMSDRVILSDGENFRACRRFTLNLAWSTYVNTLDSSTLFLKLVRYSVISM